MKTYYVKFHGYNPINACAVVVATSRPNALKAFKRHLLDHHSKLLHDNRHLNAEDFVEIKPDTAQVAILNDGEY